MTFLPLFSLFCHQNTYLSCKAELFVVLQTWDIFELRQSSHSLFRFPAVPFLLFRTYIRCQFPFLIPRLGRMETSPLWPFSFLCTWDLTEVSMPIFFLPLFPPLDCELCEAGASSFIFVPSTDLTYSKWLVEQVEQPL